MAQEKSRGVVSDQRGKLCVLPVCSQGEIKRCYYYGNQLLRNTFLLHRNSLLRPAWGHSPWDSFRRHFPSRGPLIRGCRRTCFSSQWVPQCCANHYGRDCRGESLALSRPGPVPCPPCGRVALLAQHTHIHECASREKGGQGAPAC